MFLDISNGYPDLDLAYKKTSKKLLGHYAGFSQIIVGQLFLNGVLKSLTDTYKNKLLLILNTISIILQVDTYMNTRHGTNSI